MGKYWDIKKEISRFWTDDARKQTDFGKYILRSNPNDLPHPSFVSHEYFDSLFTISLTYSIPFVVFYF